MCRWRVNQEVVHIEGYWLENQSDEHHLNKENPKTRVEITALRLGRQFEVFTDFCSHTNEWHSVEIFLQVQKGLAIMFFDIVMHQMVVSWGVLIFTVAVAMLVMSYLLLNTLSCIMSSFRLNFLSSVIHFFRLDKLLNSRCLLRLNNARWLHYWLLFLFLFATFKMFSLIFSCSLNCSRHFNLICCGLILKWICNRCRFMNLRRF